MHDVFQIYKFYSCILFPFSGSTVLHLILSRNSRVMMSRAFRYRQFYLFITLDFCLRSMFDFLDSAQHVILVLVARFVLAS